MAAFWCGGPIVLGVRWPELAGGDANADIQPAFIYTLSHICTSDISDTSGPKTHDSARCVV
jgi:hypothetical protein